MKNQEFCDELILTLVKNGTIKLPTIDLSTTELISQLPSETKHTARAQFEKIAFSLKGMSKRTAEWLDKCESEKK